MQRLAAAVFVLSVCVACGDQARLPDRSASAPLALPRPAPPSAWPPPPRFPRDSCWARDVGAGPLVSAPQELPPPPSAPPPPEAVLRALEGAFGDSSLIRAAWLGRPPAEALAHPRSYFGGDVPPTDGVWLYVSAPAAGDDVADPPPVELSKMMLAEWEVALFGAGLRDRLCAARSSPLIGWSNVDGNGFVVSDSVYPFGLRFPTPDEHVFRGVLGRVAARFGAEVRSVRFVRGRQRAPIVVLAARDRASFTAGAPRLMEELDPHTGVAMTWEGFFLEVVDDDGTFLRLSRAQRGQVFGGQWAWDYCHLPYAHSSPLGAPRCPEDEE